MSELRLPMYGKIEGVTYLENYNDGSPKACALDKKNLICTPVGNLIPSYGSSSTRKRQGISLEFFQNGHLKSINLEESVEANTPLGVLSVERISFYEDGNIHRFFPLNEQINGYWIENDESKLATSIDFDLTVGAFSSKVISICFYEGGSLKSLTLWPGETIELFSPDGLVKVRYGLSLYEDGTLKSFEPAFPEPITTPIGIIIAYNNNAHGINADKNSVCYDEHGKIKSLLTSNSALSISSDDGKRFIQPQMKPGKFNPDVLIPEPMEIIFYQDEIKITQDTIIYEDLKNKEIKAILIDDPLKKACGNCSECSHCS